MIHVEMVGDLTAAIQDELSGCGGKLRIDPRSSEGVPLLIEADFFQLDPPTDGTAVGHYPTACRTLSWAPRQWVTCRPARVAEAYLHDLGCCRSASAAGVSSCTPESAQPVSTWFPETGRARPGPALLGAAADGRSPSSASWAGLVDPVRHPSPRLPRYQPPMASYVVRYGGMRILGVFEAASKQQFQRGAEVIVRTDRGLEAGEVLCEATERALARIKDPAEGQILRADDRRRRQRARRIHDQEKGEFDICRKLHRQAGAGDEPGRRRAHLRRRADRRLLPGRRPGRFPRAGPDAGRRVPDPHRDAADRRPRRGQADGRLRRLRQAGLLQHPPGRRCRRSR